MGSYPSSVCSAMRALHALGQVSPSGRVVADAFACSPTPSSLCRSTYPMRQLRPVDKANAHVPCCFRSLSGENASRYHPSSEGTVAGPSRVGLHDGLVANAAVLLLGLNGDLVILFVEEQVRT